MSQSSVRSRTGRLVASTLAAVLGAGLLAGTVALAAPAGAVTPSGSGTNPVPVTWTPTCGTWSSQTAPAGLVSASSTVIGGGGGAGNLRSGGAGGASVAATYALPAGATTLWAYLGCGGGAGSGGPGQGGTGANGTGDGSGGAGGSAAAPGGGGGGASVLCAGTSAANCAGGTILAVAGGGGAGGGRSANVRQPGSGGTSGSGTTTVGANATTVDGSTGGNAFNGGTATGGGAGTVSGAGTGGTGGYPGSAGSNGTGGAGGSTTGVPEATDAGGGGGGGGLSGAGGGGGDYCPPSCTNNPNAAGAGGGGGSSWLNTSPALNVHGVTLGAISGTATGCGATSSQCSTGRGGQGGQAPGNTGTPGAVRLTWHIGAVAIQVTGPSTGTVSSSATTGPFTVTLLDSQNNPVGALNDTTISLGSNSGGVNEFSLTSGGAPVTSIVIPANVSSGTFWYGDEAAGSPTLSASGTGLSTGTASVSLAAGSPYSAAFTTIAPVGAASTDPTIGPSTVQLYDQFGNPAVSSGPTEVDLQSSSANGIFAATSGGAPVSSVTIGDGDGSVDFYYADTTVGTPTLTASPGALTPIQETATIVAAGAYQLQFTTSPVSGQTGSGNTVGPLTVQLQDQFGNPQTSPVDETLSLASTSSYGTFATSSGGSDVTSVTLPAHQSSVSFWYGDLQGGTPTITVSEAGLVPATQAATMTNLIQVTNPGSQSSVSGTAIKPLPIQATDSSPVATLSYSATGLPAGLSIDPNSGIISGTPTTACSCSVSVVVSDDAGASAGTLFSWSVTNVVTVTNPGNQASNEGTPVSLGNSATTSSSTATIASWAATGLPHGLSIDPNSGTISGTPDQACSCAVHLTATDSAGFSGSTDFTWNVGVAPSITSGSTTTFTAGHFGTFTVTTTGTPTAALSETGALPGGVTFTDNGNGTATLSGTPAGTARGNYPLTITASNGIPSDAQQSFTLVVNNSPLFTSTANPAFVIGQPNTFTVTTVGPPGATSITKTGNFPSQLTYTDNGDGTATISGTPTGSPRNLAAVTLKATNTVGSTTQSLVITLGTVPSFTSGASRTFKVGQANTFNITVSAAPTASISESGALPVGVTFMDNGDGTGTLAGNIPSGDGGTFPLLFTATNSHGTTQQNFTLTVTETPAITSANTTTFHGGVSNTFTVTATVGYPGPLTLSSTGLPSGVSFVDHGNGTGTLSGTPVAGTNRTYNVTFTARNGAGSVNQAFSLVIVSP
jgi:hypothetical protein